MIEVHFISVWDELSSGIPYLRVGLTDRKYPAVAARVLIEDDSQPVMAIDVCGNQDDYFFKQSVLLWNNWVVVGVGHQVTLVNLTNHSSTTTNLKHYFGYLYLADDLLLVASAMYLHCFGSDGQPLWISPVLGIDGVIVDQIGGGTVKGVGEWDPPGGWKPFNVSLATGQPVPLT
jgi:hypothetical protein